MALQGCNCEDSGLSNTGLPTCIPTFGVTKKVIMVPLFANDGTPNRLDLSLPIDATLINGLINNVDRSKAWYPIPGELKNVEKPKAENITQTYPDGSIYFIAEGRRSWSGEWPSLGSIFAGTLKANRCSSFGIYEIDNSGSILGSSNGEVGYLYPVAVDPNTWAPLWNAKTDTTLENTKLTFQYSSLILDEYFTIVSGQSVTGINLLSIVGLIDVMNTYVSNSTTVMVTKLYTKYGTAAKGLVAADFAMFNVTTSSPVAITTVVEAPAGTYTITHAAAVVTNKLRLTPTKAGFDYTKVIANLATV